MRKLRRILITASGTFAVILVGVIWGAPVALSFYAARKVPPVARIVPVDLKNTFVSLAPGTKLSYFGYEFEVPWSDLDERQTKLYPADKPKKTLVVLTFRSGLRLKVTAIPAHEWTSSTDPDIRLVPRVVLANFGYGAIQSDYSLVKSIYEFTPDRMHYWALKPSVHYREEALLAIKSVMLLAPADTGIFKIKNQNFKGFQQGDPQVRQARLEFELYSEDGSVEFVFFEKKKNSGSITQPEINRIVETLRRVVPNPKTPSIHQGEGRTGFADRSPES